MSSCWRRDVAARRSPKECYREYPAPESRTTCTRGRHPTWTLWNQWREVVRPLVRTRRWLLVPHLTACLYDLRTYILIPCLTRERCWWNSCRVVVEWYSDHGFNEVRDNSVCCGCNWHNKFIVFSSSSSSSETCCNTSVTFHALFVVRIWRFLARVVRWRYCWRPFCPSVRPYVALVIHA